MEERDLIFSFPLCSVPPQLLMNPIAMSGLQYSSLQPTVPTIGRGAFDHMVPVKSACAVDSLESRFTLL